MKGLSEELQVGGFARPLGNGGACGLVVAKQQHPMTLQLGAPGLQGPVSSKADAVENLDQSFPALACLVRGPRVCHRAHDDPLGAGLA